MLCALLTALLAAESPLALPHARDGSGTSWLPDATPLYMWHAAAGPVQLMLHGSASLGYDDQWGPRGSRRAISTNWVMGMATGALLGGEAQARAMLSLEPLTAGGLGAPLLLQSGET